jgi:Na+-transporting NADH:ubiquinone oxidoreductase subunit NqrF
VADFCDANLNLLAHAQAVECDLGSECGGHGICGQDRIRISRPDGSPAALSRHTEEEMRHLSERDRNAGWRLACQVFPEAGQADLIVEVLSGRNSPA